MADADLVLEGGGVKGTGLVGAITALASAAEPYVFHRVAGTSAGAIVASMLAAGYTAAEMNTIMTKLDFSQFEDNPGIFARHFEQIGEALGLILHEGLFAGQFLHDWMERTLAAKNVHAWGDLKDDDPGSSLPPSSGTSLSSSPRMCRGGRQEVPRKTGLGQMAAGRLHNPGVDSHHASVIVRAPTQGQQATGSQN